MVAVGPQAEVERVQASSESVREVLRTTSPVATRATVHDPAEVKVLVAGVAVQGTRREADYYGTAG